MVHIFSDAKKKEKKNMKLDNIFFASLSIQIKEKINKKTQQK